MQWQERIDQARKHHPEMTDAEAQAAAADGMLDNTVKAEEIPADYQSFTEPVRDYILFRGHQRGVTPS